MTRQSNPILITTMFGATLFAPALASAADLSDISNVAEAVAPAVVSITTRGTADRGRSPFGDGNAPDFFREFRFGPGPARPPQPTMGAASGVLLSSEGLVVTNNHVVREANELKVHLADGRSFIAKLIGTDESSDLALLRIDAKGLPFLKWGDARALRLGEVVLAVGNPFGVGQTVTMGIVSATGRNRVGIVDYEDFIQTDAAINPGNSGGALVNMRGELVGINTAILSRTGGTQGVGFAVPSSMAQPILEQLLASGKVRRGWLGVGIQDLTPELAQQLDIKAEHGVVVSDVIAGGPAEKAGLTSGDVVLRIDGRPIRDAAQLRNAVALATPGSKLRLEIERKAQPKEITVRLDERKVEGQAQDGNEPGAPTPSGELKLQPLSKELRQQLKVPPRVEQGVVVADLAPDSRAARAGVRPGDVIVTVGKRAAKSPSDVDSALASNEPVLLRILRDGSFMFVVVQP